MPQVRARAQTARTLSWRVDTEQPRLRHPIADLVGTCGIELRRSGSRFTRRCPTHADGGRPNLAVFPRSGRWVCFRCDARGDAIAFVQRIGGLSFREAVARLGGACQRYGRCSVRLELPHHQYRDVRQHARSTPKCWQPLSSRTRIGSWPTRPRWATWSLVALTASCSNASTLALQLEASSSRILRGEASHHDELVGLDCSTKTDGKSCKAASCFPRFARDARCG
jgi:hypothetical protein